MVNNFINELISIPTIASGDLLIIQDLTNLTDSYKVTVSDLLNFGAFLQLSGGTMTGTLDMGSQILDNVSKINDDGTHPDELGVINLANNKFIQFADDGGTVVHKMGVDTSGFFSFIVGENEPFLFRNDFGSCTLRLFSTITTTATSPTVFFNREFTPTVPNTDMGLWIFRGKSDLGNSVDYARIRTFARILTDGIEEGAWNLQVARNGVDNVNCLDLNSITLYVRTNNGFNFSVPALSKINLDAAGDSYLIGEETTANTIKIYLGGTLEYDWSGTAFDLKGNNLDNAGDIEIDDAKNIILNTTTGTKIGTATTQKLGFYNATPIVQGSAVTDPTGGAVIDAEARTAIIALNDRLQALGLIA